MAGRYVRSMAINQMPWSASSFVGRRRELAFIWDRYQAAKTGYGGVVLLMGELGIGKTRILDEFALRATGDGAIVLRGGSFEAEAMPAYLPFLEALGHYIRITSPDLLRAQIAHAPHTLSTLLPELAAYLDDTPVPYLLPPEQARLRLYEAIGLFLEHISASQVLVLILDDLHRVDSASLDLLCYITQHHARAKLLILGAYREGKIDHKSSLDRVLVELTHQRVLTTIAIDPLSSEEIAALAGNYLGGPICTLVGSLLYTQSEGNPFFAEELIRGWVGTNALVKNQEQWTAVGSLENTLPLSIVGVVRQHLALLSAETLGHLRVAAVIGRTFDVPLLAAVEGQTIETIEECLLEAEQARLVRLDHDDVFLFSHDKIRECLYAEVSSSRRRRLHGAIAQILEARYEQESTKSAYLLALIAFHFTHSGNTERAVVYAMQAAEQAARAFAIEEAKSYYHMALRHLSPENEWRGGLLLGLGETALLAGAEDEAIIAYEEALEWFSRSGELEAAADASYGLGLAQWRWGDLLAAKASLEHALVLLGGRMSVEKARVLHSLATLLTISADQQTERTSYAEQALEITRYRETGYLEATSKRILAGRIYITANEMPGVLSTLEQALTQATGLNDFYETAQCCFAISCVCYCMGEVRRASEMSTRRIKFIERSRQLYQLRDAHSWHALLLSSLGAWTEAEQELERAQSLVGSLSNPFLQALLRQVRGFLAFQRKDYITAERELQAAKADWQRGPAELMLFTGLLGIVQAVRGKHEEAFASIAELEPLLEELPAATIPTVPILVCLALMALALGDQERIARLYPKLLGFRGQHYWFLVDRVLGEMCVALEDWDAAAEHLEAAKTTAQREGLRPELERTMLAQAKCEMARDLKLLPANLTRSEARVLQLVVQGKRNRQIAEELGISEKTVANHLSHIFSKTTSENRAAAVAFAMRHGIN